MHTGLLQDIGLCIVAATALAFVARLLRQPLLLGYIAAGIVIGPHIGLGWVHDEESISLLSELGLALLMFIVGLEIELPKLLVAGKPAAITTAVQVTIGAVLGWLAAVLLGYGGLAAAYLAAAAALSSTMIVIKLLSDRGELDTLPGKVTLGILLLQDVVAILIQVLQPSIGQDLPISRILLIIVRAAALVASSIVFSRYFLPFLFRWVATSPELLVLSAVSWCLFICFLALMLDFSLAMGALLAGVSISAFPYSLDVIAKIRGLRDFFVTLFFVALGMQLRRPDGAIIAHAFVLSTVVIASRFLSIWPTLRLLRYGHRVGLLSSIHLSQTSEFSLVIAVTGLLLHPDVVTERLFSLMVIVLIITATASTYLIQLSHPIARLLTPRSAGPLADGASGGHERRGAAADIVLVGCFRVGNALVPRLHAAGRDFAVIDFNPELHARLRAMGIRCMYGDISHFDTLEHAGVDHARVLVCSISDDFLRGTDNLTLLRSLRKLNPTAVIIVTAESIEKARQFYAQGADYVLTPPLTAADDLLEAIEDGLAGRLDQRRAARLAEFDRIGPTA
jgi:Kef-type K+ transport system membrane component KefB/CheY-like chemotaxis protein